MRKFVKEFTEYREGKEEIGVRQQCSRCA